MKKIYQSTVGKIMPYVLAGSLIFNGCATTINKYGTPLDVKLEQRIEETKKEYDYINKTIKKYQNNLEMCEFKDWQYLIKPQKIEIYSGKKRETFNTPSDEEAWVLSQTYRNLRNLDPKEIQKCTLEDSFKDVYHKLKKQGIFVKYKDANITYVEGFRTNNDILFILSPEDKNTGLATILYNKDGQLYKLYTPLQEGSIKEIYKSKAILTKLSKSLAFAIGLGLGASTPLIYGIIPLIPYHIINIAKEKEYSKEALDKIKKDMKYEKYTVVANNEKELLENLSIMYYSLAGKSEDSRREIVLLDTINGKPMALIYIGKDMSLKPSQNIFGIGNIPTDTRKEVLKRIAEMGLYGILGYSTGNLMKEVNKHNYKRGPPGPQGPQGPPGGGGNNIITPSPGGSDEGGNVIGGSEENNLISPSSGGSDQQGNIMGN